MTREALLARTLVELADNLVDDFDIVELLTTLSDRCVEVLDIAAAGIMLVAPNGELRVMTSSSEAMRVVELFELQSQEGPCLDCYRSGEAVVNHDLAVRRQPLAPLRRSRPRSRLPFRRCRADAPALAGHRRPQPVPQRTRRAQRQRTSSSPRPWPTSPRSPCCSTAPPSPPRSSTSSSPAPSTAASSSNRPRASSPNGIALDMEQAFSGCAPTPAPATNASATSPSTSSTAPSTSRTQGSRSRRDDGSPHGQPTPGAGASSVSTCPVRLAMASSTFSIPFHSAASMNSVRRSGPPRAQAKPARSSSIRCRISPPSPDSDALAFGVVVAPGVRTGVGRVRPDCAIGVEADAVGADAVGPDAAVRQAAVGGDVEGGEAAGEGLGDDQRRVVGRDRHAVGELDLVGDLADHAIRGDQRDEPGRRARHRPGSRSRCC